jgi:hypothetical protein
VLSSVFAGRLESDQPMPPYPPFFEFRKGGLQMTSKNLERRKNTLRRTNASTTGWEFVKPAATLQCISRIAVMLSSII